MKIMKKISDMRNEIENDASGQKGRNIGSQAVAAMLEGRKPGGAWEKYMTHFRSNGDQLKRLLGQDKTFNDQPDQFGKSGYGDVILAYVVAAGVCMSGTALRDAANMPDEMADKLDADLSDAADPQLVEKPLEAVDGGDQPGTFVSA